MPTITAGSTANRSCTRASSARFCCQAARPLAIRWSVISSARVLRERHGEFRLVAGALQHLLVGLHAGERVLKGGGGDTRASGLGAQSGEEICKTVRRGAGGDGKARRERGSQ